MIVIGLCGNSGSGKGTVGAYFSKHGIPSIDADLVYRDLIAPGSELVKRLSDNFGTEILNPDLSLNRSALSEKVFSDKSGMLLKKLNKITHSSIIAETERRIDLLSKSGGKAIVFDAPLLFESGFNEKCDFIIAVTADLETKIRRIMKRDSIDYAKARARIDSQLSEDFLRKNADFIIDNSVDNADIEDSVKKIIKNIINCEV